MIRSVFVVCISFVVSLFPALVWSGNCASTYYQSSTYNPSNGKAHLQCIDADNGKMMFDVEMQNLSDLLFVVTRVTGFIHSDTLPADTFTLNTQLVPSFVPEQPWLFIEVSDASVHGDICRAYASVSTRPSTDPEQRGLWRIDIKVFEQDKQCELVPNHFGGSGPYHLAPQTVPVEAGQRYQIYVNDHLKTTVEVPAVN